MSQVTLSNQSTWASKLKAMGPGILMASAAVGGSPPLKLVVLMVGLYSSWLSWPMFLNIHFSVLVPNILLILVKPWSKATLKKASSISGFSLSSMSSLLWSIQLESLSFAQPSSLAPSQ